MMKSLKKSLFPLIFLICLQGGQSYGQQNNSIKLNPDSTKIFTIDENTGEVKGCDLIKLTNVWAGSKVNSTKIDSINTINKIEHIQKLKRLGDQLFGFYSKDKKVFICQDLSHGGNLNAIYFFNAKLKLINKYIFKSSKVREVRFNTEETCVIVTETDSYNNSDDDFFIFNLSGGLKKKGNFLKKTSIKSSNSLDVYVNKDLTKFALNRKDCFIFSWNENIISSIKGGVNSFGFLQNDKLILCDKLGKLQIRNIMLEKVLYESNNIIPNLFVKNNGFVFINLKNKAYSYEINEKY